MSHFAKVENGVVTQVIVAEQEFVDTQPGTWIQTSYNTLGGVHTLGGTPLRKNYAGIGFHYDGTGFYAPQPFPSWTLDPDTYLWQAPVPCPTDGQMYEWDEASLSWVTHGRG